MASIAPASILPLFHFCILPSTVNHQPFLMSRILVIEDDPSIRQGIVDALEFDGFQTLEAAEGHKGLELSLKCDYDLLLLDLVLPGIEGLDILREIRKLRPTQPVIILTARGAENDRVQGLRLGADDYVVKPFSVKELLARIDAVIRRSPERPVEVEEIEFPGGRADLNRCAVCRDVFSKDVSRSWPVQDVRRAIQVARNVNCSCRRDRLERPGL